MNPEQLNQFLPQTQCRECGFSGCLPYAQALAKGEADIHLCAPGGEIVMRDLARALHRPEIPPQKSHQNAIAWIIESECIGCTACIRACPVDAIMGATKLMHSVLSDECTGCGLCVAPCPVDCIEMRPVDDEFLPRARFLSQQTESRFAAAEHAKMRHEARERRRTAPKSPSVSPRISPDAPKPTFNAAALIAQAMNRAQSHQNQRVGTQNQEKFRQHQIQEAKEKATFRRQQQLAQYGSGAEKATAIEWLRQYKAAHEDTP